MKRPCRIAIDGPVGAGKSSVARQVAQRLGLTYVDTGALYRCVALAASRRGLSPEKDAETIGALARQVEITFLQPEGEGPQRVLLDGEDVTEAIRTPEITELASPVSAIPAVREALFDLQRAFAAAGDVMMEGRDIQTVIMPEADLKVFLVASVEERARRRQLQYRQQGREVPLETLIEQVKARDERDSKRSLAPLKPAPDAVLLETDDLSEAEVVDKIVTLAREKCRG